jgi:hypothetical protein
MLFLAIPSKTSDAMPFPVTQCHSLGKAVPSKNADATPFLPKMVM